MGFNSGFKGLSAQGGGWCGHPGRQSPRGGKMDNKINIL